MLHKFIELYARVFDTVLEKCNAVPPLYKAALLLTLVYNAIIRN